MRKWVLARCLAVVAGCATCLGGCGIIDWDEPCSLPGCGAPTPVYNPYTGQTTYQYPTYAPSPPVYVPSAATPPSAVAPAETPPAGAIIDGSSGASSDTPRMRTCKEDHPGSNCAYVTPQ